MRAMGVLTSPLSHLTSWAIRKGLSMLPKTQLSCCPQFLDPLYPPMSPLCLEKPEVVDPLNPSDLKQDGQTSSSRVEGTLFLIF